MLFAHMHVGLLSVSIKFADSRFNLLHASVNIVCFDPMTVYIQLMNGLSLWSLWI
jgi:hypothetical protein